MKLVKLPYKLPSASEKRKKLKEIIEKKITTIIPGVYNTAVAMIAEKIGFKAVYVGGAAITLGMGLPDLGIITRNQMLYEAKKIADFVSLPVICDVDTGYGDIKKTVKCFENSGISGIQIEDQEEFKKCGHLPNKRIISLEEMVRKIKVAVKARKDENFLIIARTDARDVNGIEDVINRANAYFEAGADVIFPEALKTKEEFEYVAKMVKAPLIANMTEYGKTPYFTAKEFRKMGYYLVLFPVTTLRASLKTAEEVLIELKKFGTQKRFVNEGRMKTRKELQELIRYDEWEAMINKKFVKRNKL
jgi:methylisocitrate lyase